MGTLYSGLINIIYGSIMFHKLPHEHKNLRNHYLLFEKNCFGDSKFPVQFGLFACHTR